MMQQKRRRMKTKLYTLFAVLCCSASSMAQEANDNALRINFKGDDAPIETEHPLLGTHITFSEDGRAMNLTVHDATATYPLLSVAGMTHFLGTPTAVLHANEDPDHSGDYYTTFYSGLEAYTLPAGVVAYTGVVDGDIVRLKVLDGDVLPQGEAVLLSAKGSGEMTLVVADPSAATASAGNEFHGVDVATSQPDYGASSYYMLSYGQNKLGFYRMNATMPLAANKAFLATAAAGSTLRIMFPTGTIITSLDAVEGEAPSAEVYSPAGVRLANPQQGINIVGGKKVVIL